MSTGNCRRYQQGMKAKARRPYHHGDLREKLLAAGEQALAETPLANVTLREIARRAGVSHAAPKHHFSSLGELLGEIAARGFERFVISLAEGADALESATPSQSLLAMGHRYFAFAAANPAIYGLMFGKRDQCELTPHLSEAAQGAWQQLETAVSAIVGPEQAERNALLVFSTVHGYATLKLEKRLPPHAINAESETRLLQGMVAGLKTHHD